MGVYCRVSENLLPRHLISHSNILCQQSPLEGVGGSTVE
jgi:hypothetical protein